MFKTLITSTPFSTDIANELFSNIWGDGFNGGDYSFISTLRALLAPRMTDDDSLHLRFIDKYVSRSKLEQYVSAYGVSGTINTILSDWNDVSVWKNSFNVFYFTNSPENNQAWMEFIEKNLCEVCKYHRLEKVTMLFRKVFNVLCFVNPEIKSTIIFCESLDTRKMHYLQAAILGCVPWYFNAEDGITQDERDLIESLRGKSATTYLECLKKIAQQYDFKTAKIKKYLSGFETLYERQAITDVTNKIESTRSEIDFLNDKIAEYLRQQREYEIKLLGLEESIRRSNDESEIMEYFLCNNHLVLENVRGTVLTFGCRDYITYFDEEMAKNVIENENSFVYLPNGRRCNNIIPAEDMKKLMTAIFLEQTLRIKVCAVYTFDINGNVRSIQGYNYGSEYMDCTPNTHIDRFSCLGNHIKYINEILKNRDYIGAIEQCISSCKSLNFGDISVMQEFFKRFYGISEYHVNMRCIELPDGSVVTPKEAVAFLNKEESNGETD